MNKKIARKRKKIVSQVRDHRVLQNGRILGADGQETLLGNLAPVKQIPMLPWKHVIAFPTQMKEISVATEGKNAWFYQMLEKSTHLAHDLIGFTPVGTLDSDTFANVGVESVGMAVQVLKIEPPENGRAIVHLKGICRYENKGFLPSTEDHFRINVRWFEDNREADALVKPEVDRCMEIFKTISEVLSRAKIEGLKERADRKHYDFRAAQYLSFSLLDGAQKYFDEEENRELLLTRSTSKRFKKLNEYFEELLAETERRFKDRVQD